MSVFILETNSMQSATSSMQALSSQVSNLASTIEGYDTSCEDNFDFGGAKSAIANNLDACAVKIMNTAYVLDNVCNSHIKLQETLKFEETLADFCSAESYDLVEDLNAVSAPSSPSTAPKSTTETGSEDSESNTSEETYTDTEEVTVTPVPVGGVGTETTEETNVSKGATTSAGVIGAVIGANAFFEEKSKESKRDADNYFDEKTKESKRDADAETDNNTNQETRSYAKEEHRGKEKEVDNTDFEKVEMATVVDEKLSEESRDFFSGNKFTERGGLMMYGDKFVVACDTSVGNVGDFVRFKTKDGKIVNCIIGVTTRARKNKGVFNFVVTSANNVTTEAKKFCASLFN